MKKIFTLTLLIAACTLLHAQGIYVYKTNGDVVRLLNAEIDSIVAFPTELAGHEAVDLGLSVKWAACNIGADMPEDAGDYFAWGEIAPKSQFMVEGYPYYEIDFQSLMYKGVIDKFGSLTARYDAAKQLWGGIWRVPTSAEQEELRRECKWQWTEKGGVTGYNVTGPNGNTIFLPAAGYCLMDTKSGVGEVGYYWSATAYHDYSSSESLFFYKGVFNSFNDNRAAGLPIRPVAE